MTASKKSEFDLRPGACCGQPETRPDLLGAPKHFGSVNVMPPRITDVGRADFALPSHQSNAIGQTAIAVTPSPPQKFEDPG
ncbi:MAG: hypothetical protein H0W04_02405 [Chthoniobacterales bacterium]|nr:hypothetical protein [Chthoniobacterales bacterium]